MDNAIKPVTQEQEEKSAKVVRLAAFDHDEQLSAEAAAQLVKMRADRNIPAHKGKQLATISEAELLERLG